MPHPRRKDCEWFSPSSAGRSSGRQHLRPLARELPNSLFDLGGVAMIEQSVRAEILVDRTERRMRLGRTSRARDPARRVDHAQDRDGRPEGAHEHGIGRKRRLGQRAPEVRGVRQGGSAAPDRDRGPGSRWEFGGWGRFCARRGAHFASGERLRWGRHRQGRSLRHVLKASAQRDTSPGQAPYTGPGSREWR